MVRWNAYSLEVSLFSRILRLTVQDKDQRYQGSNNVQLNSHYEEVYKIQGANGLDGDFHEFQITRDDTALFAVYEVLQTDLREVNGPEKGWIYDGLFQEVDVETNELLFQWRASEHLSLQEAERDREADGETEDNPWDFFHINSIDKDWRGNYLVSSRYMNSLAYIDGRTGDIIWKLGGKQNSFLDLSNGAATNISWQHHARFQVRSDTNATRMISLFDNASRGEGAPEHTSRGLIIEINEEAMTAAMVQEYWNPTPISSQSQGSMQVLENGDVVVGYGYSAAWTQFTADGEPLCEVHFGPHIEFHHGQIVSYRVFKQEWIGLPLTSPSVALSGTQAAVSWNGATEVVTWVLQGALPGVKVNGNDSAVGIRQRNDEKHDLEFEFITAIPKSGFETIIPLPADRVYSKLRIIALDKKGLSLGATKALDWEPEEMNTQVAVYSGQEPQDDGNTGAAPDATSPWSIGIGLITVSILGFCVWLLCRITNNRSVMGLFSRDKDEQAWQTVSTAEELEEFDGFGDIESGDHASDSLLKQQEE
jgi:hypothetical protein